MIDVSLYGVYTKINQFNKTTINYEISHRTIDYAKNACQ